ncbi:hypothetical protein BAZSYMB_GCONTIG00654_0 [Bathymodiolus azoricus thioautotrophic gill symbiont]|uniref:Uncharacterized protein n=1 Tax=Bathymodiolus azoricus thioautotrophic gill symbiont TaxID=235205 RepID=A0A1H6MMJ1_9GAMM|nr:hypothetical protein BAZSYMB_GCONTIG00654_0 [Bathymodiolus azoricus thioautotrophic gill symbiont]SEH98866.1 hypothetical protein BAZSYMA_ACONTIG12338_0 [Bathymodiolus azoricus thioautotrophic gill symbiont]
MAGLTSFPVVKSWILILSMIYSEPKSINTHPLPEGLSALKPRSVPSTISAGSFSLSVKVVPVELFSVLYDATSTPLLITPTLSINNTLGSVLKSNLVPLTISTGFFSLSLQVLVKLFTVLCNATFTPSLITSTSPIDNAPGSDCLINTKRIASIGTGAILRAIKCLSFLVLLELLELTK